MNLLLIGAAVWAGGYARVAIYPVQETMRTALGMSDHGIALIQGPAIAVSVMAGSIPLGMLIDRYSRVRLLFVFLLLCLFGSVLTALTSDLIVLCIARSAVALGEIASLIAVFSLIGDSYEPEQRGRASMIAGLGELGSPIAFAIGGSLLVTYASDPDGWRWAMLWMSVPPLALVTLLVLTMREPPRTGVVTDNPAPRAALAQLWRYRPIVVPLLLGRCMIWVADGATVVWAAPFFARRFDLPPDRIGAIMATVLLIAGLVSTVLGGFVTDYCHAKGGPRATMLAMAALSVLGVFTGLFALMPSALLASTLLVIFITSGFTVNGIGAAVAIVVVPNEVRGTYVSVTMVMGSLFGLAIAPVLISSLCDALGGPSKITGALAITCFLASLLAMAIFGAGSRHFSRTASIA